MKLREYLESHDIPQAVFAARVGVARTTVFRWCRDESTPELAAILAIQRESGGLVTALDWSKDSSATSGANDLSGAPAPAREELRVERDPEAA